MHSKRTLLLTAFLLVGLLSAGCVVKAPPATMSASDPAAQQVCFANQQAIEQQVIQALLTTDKRMPINYGQLKGQGFIKELLWCPAGGDYVWEPTSMFLMCELHGHFDAPKPLPQQ